MYNNTGAFTEHSLLCERFYVFVWLWFLCKGIYTGKMEKVLHASNIEFSCGKPNICLTVESLGKVRQMLSVAGYQHYFFLRFSCNHFNYINFHKTVREQSFFSMYFILIFSLPNFEEAWKAAQLVWWLTIMLLKNCWLKRTFGCVRLFFKWICLYYRCSSCLF